jgi:hypothetical protein
MTDETTTPVVEETETPVEAAPVEEQTPAETPSEETPA